MSRCKHQNILNIDLKYSALAYVDVSVAGQAQHVCTTSWLTRNTPALLCREFHNQEVIVPSSGMIPIRLLVPE